MVVFAVQDVIKDPPFTRLNLLSCRNLLIYFEPELQNRLIPSFHYSLKPGGILLLSPSESIGRFTDLFTTVSRKWKIFSARQFVSPALTAGDLHAPGDHRSDGQRHPGAGLHQRETNFVELTRRILLQSYAPPTVITDNEGTHAVRAWGHRSLSPTCSWAGKPEHYRDGPRRTAAETTKSDT